MDDEDLFASSMSSLGVEPLEGACTAARAPGRALEEFERRLFEQAVEDLDAVDDPRRDRPRPAAVRKVKARAKDLRIGEHLDLHGLAVEEALARLERFVDRAARSRRRTLLVITGKGHHSPAGVGVVKRRVEEWIRRRGRQRVEAFAEAPPRLGGGGAYVLFLRR